MKTTVRKLFDHLPELDWNTVMYTHGLGVVKTGAAAQQMHSGFGKVKPRLSVPAQALAPAAASR